MGEGLRMSAGEIEEDGRKQKTTKSESRERGGGGEGEVKNGENDGGTSSNGGSQAETGNSSESEVAGVPEDVASEEKNKSRQNKMPEVSPQKTADIISLIFFWWLNGLLWRGYKQPLEEEDLWPLMPRDSSSIIRDRFEKTVCKKNASGIPNGKRLSLASQLFLTFKLEIITTAILRLASDALLPFPSLLLNAVLLYMDYNDHTDKAQENFMYKLFGRNFGLYAAAGLFIVPCLRALVENHYMVRAFIVGNRMKVSLINSLYEKTLGLSTAARQKKSVGETVTLMQVDAVKVGDAMPFFHGLWSGLLQVGLTVGLLVNFIGTSALVGTALILFTLPLQTAIVNRMIACQKDIMTNTSERVKVLNEVIQGIRVVKSSAWERPFKASVEESRTKELKAILRRVILRASHITLMLSTPLLIMVATFAFYTKVQQRTLIPSTIFTAVALFTALRGPLIMYPMVVNNLISAHISVKRIDAFLKLDDVKLINRQASDTSDTASSDNEESDDKKPLCALEIEGDFQWVTLPPDSKKSKSSKAGKGSSAKSSDSAAGKKTQSGMSSEKVVHVSIDTSGETEGKADEKKAKGATDGNNDVAPFGISDISLKLKRGELIAVVGPVGSGKSSFVSALLGDMEQKKGPPIVIRGSLAYCSQQAWIMNATLRDNILFGKEFDEITYDAVMSACALEQDLLALPNGDLTEIGERGINLSGGQKQRVSLARAVYADTDIYVLDDPLSAVDAHVGAHLFSHCINGSLAGKTRIFVTNQLQFVPEADAILIMKEGRIVQQGTYKELMELGTDFSQLMKGSGADKADNKAEGPPDSNSKEGALKKNKSSDKLKANGKQLPNKNGANKGTLVEVESKAVGQLQFAVYKTYWTAVSKVAPIAIMLLFSASQSVEVFSNFWLAYWTGNRLKKSSDFYLGIYSGLGSLYALTSFACVVVLLVHLLWTSTFLHKGLLDAVLRGSMTFFDTTPVGRILNRFSNDVSVTDEALPGAWNMTLTIFFMVLGALVAIVSVTPLFLLVLFPVSGLYAFIQQIYRKTGRELKRIEAVTKSPLYQQFSETLNGLTTIRAYQAEKRFIKMNDDKLDVNSKAYVLLRYCDRWLSMNMELLGSVMVTSVAFLALANKDLYAGYAGVSIQYSFFVVQAVGMLMRIVTDTENQMNGVERILDYQQNIPSEGPFVVEDNRPPKDWPSEGAIEFTNVSLRYREGLPLVLRDVSLSVGGGEKVGLVGRTGSGKSSLMICLFRLVDPVSGHVVIDGIQTNKIGLEDLRSRMSIIPQDPVLFSGTVRSNLDPFHLYSDDIIWDALQQAHLKDKISSMPLKLESKIVEYGENLSVGERQLICLARILLRRSKIIVMDEATSSVDYETDKLIQATIHKYMRGTTLLVIAHRIHTVIDADKIVVMADGQVAECDTPARLLDNPMGQFTSLVKSNGERAFVHLSKIARGEMDFFAAYDTNSIEASISPSPSTANLEDVHSPTE